MVKILIIFLRTILLWIEFVYYLTLPAENGNENDLECLWDFLETSPEVLSFASKFSEYLSDEVEFGAVFNIDSINIASKAHVHGC